MQKIAKPTAHETAPAFDLKSAEGIRNGKRDLLRVYIGTLFFAFHYVLIIYTNSSFLRNFFDDRSIGLLYAIGSLLGVFLLSNTTHLLRKFGNRSLMISLSLIQILCLLTIGNSSTVAIIVAAFIVQHAIVPILYLNFDLFVEHYTAHDNAGKARGIFLSLINVIFVIVPLITGFIIANTSINSVYTIAALTLTPLIVMISNLLYFQDADYADHNLLASIKRALKLRDIRNVMFVNLLLQMFFAAMVIYMPIYLNEYFNFNWEEIGLIFTVMLMPFVLFELPLGKISDSYLGEKELMLVGIIILSFATMGVSFMTSHAIYAWATILFLTRTGASFIEIMSESYFFKKIKESDADFISLWRASNGIAYIIIPILISIFLNFWSLQYVFLILGLICLLGVFFASRITDTL